MKFMGGESAALGRVHDYFWKKVKDLSFIWNYCTVIATWIVQILSRVSVIFLFFSFLLLQGVRVTRVFLVNFFLSFLFVWCSDRVIHLMYLLTMGLKRVKLASCRNARVKLHRVDLHPSPMPALARNTSCTGLSLLFSVHSDAYDRHAFGCCIGPYTF